MGDYFSHWLKMAASKIGETCRKIFHVNWFRKNADGKFLWPGFGENIRVLKWIFERVEGTGKAIESPIGYLPSPGAIDTTGLKISPEAMHELLQLDLNGWMTEIEGIKTHYAKFGDRLPKELVEELHDLRETRGQASRCALTAPGSARGIDRGAASCRKGYAGHPHQQTDPEAASSAALV